MKAPNIGAFIIIPITGNALISIEALYPSGYLHIV